MSEGHAPFRDDGVDGRLIPPGVADARANAFTEILGRAIDELPLDRLGLVDFERVDARLLPALVRGLAMQKFMFDGIPEPVIRRLLANAIPLHVAHGTVAGIKLGLQLIGMQLKLVPWFAMSPMGAPNTYEATVFVNEQILDDPEILSEANQRAALAIIDATKRWSQSGVLRIGVGYETKLGLGNAVASMSVDHRAACASPDMSRTNGFGLANGAGSMSVDQRTHEASPDLKRRSALYVAGRFACLAVQHQTFAVESV